jgi:hypothetical protein
MAAFFCGHLPAIVVECGGKPVLTAGLLYETDIPQ